MDLLINVSMSAGQAKHEGLFVAFLFVWGGLGIQQAEQG